MINGTTQSTGLDYFSDLGGDAVIHRDSRLTFELLPRLAGRPLDQVCPLAKDVVSVGGEQQVLGRRTHLFVRPS